jgi:hypothetical protein
MMCPRELQGDREFVGAKNHPPLREKRHGGNDKFRFGTLHPNRFEEVFHQASGKIQSQSITPIVSPDLSKRPASLGFLSLFLQNSWGLSGTF